MAEKKFVLVPGTGTHTEPSRGKRYKAEINGPPVIVKSTEDLVTKFPGKFRLFRSEEDLKPIGDVEEATAVQDPRTVAVDVDGKKDPHALAELKDEVAATTTDEEVEDDDKEPPTPKTGKSRATLELEDEDEDEPVVKGKVKGKKK